MCIYYFFHFSFPCLKASVLDFAITILQFNLSFADYCDKDKAILSFGIQEINIGAPFTTGFLADPHSVLVWTQNPAARTAQFVLKNQIAVGKKAISVSDIPVVPQSHNNVKLTLKVKSGATSHFAKKVIRIIKYHVHVII